MDEATIPPSDSAGGLRRKPTDRVFLVYVDSSPEMHVALRFACRRARAAHGRVALLFVMEPTEFEHWMAVAEKMREERREEAEAVLHRLALQVNDQVGIMPILYLREGRPADVLQQVIQEDPNISILVLGASAEKAGPGPLVSAIVGKLSGRFPIPITVVPGGLTEAEVDDLT